MKKLNPPNLDPASIYLTCIDSIRNADLRNLFYEAFFEFTGLYDHFKKNAKSASLRKLPLDHLPTSITKEEWIKLYDNALVQSEKARYYYDIIKTSSPNSKCPLCGTGQVSQIDHHLPKTRYPVLSVALLNLLPICSDCNKNKLSNIPQSPEDEHLHPYFDDIDNDEWLIATLDHNLPISFKFSIQKPPSWSPTLFKRVENHFYRLKLGDLFASAASDELGSRLSSLEKLYNTAGNQALREQMKDAYESSVIKYRNSWRTAMYKTLWGDDWFCNGNFIAP